ncbi:hypothetical protein NEOLEDRAFT_855389 [Neolentinus lepideus HHB14362 ss-1]|uniref:Secreted protein n=1 Tax=Neolentinus lepideus HHB14362 ss-1 TaxID=1314782 RepID=A0A165UQ99_9AGAM|nr:hypothetical protein NEOLEDRAFT_855389 [Neolentinus lepideus HHB14362 ss-1]
MTMSWQLCCLCECLLPCLWYRSCTVTPPATRRLLTPHLGRAASLYRINLRGSPFKKDALTHAMYSTDLCLSESFSFLQYSVTVTEPRFTPFPVVGESRLESQSDRLYHRADRLLSLIIS